MKILMLFPYAPLPPPRDLGGTKRNLPFLKENSRRHAVTVLSFGTADEDRAFRNAFGAMCEEIHFVGRRRSKIRSAVTALWYLLTGKSLDRLFFHEDMQKRIDEVTKNANFDLIHTCTQFFGFYRFPKGPARITDTHEVTFDLWRRAFLESKSIVRKVTSYVRYRFGEKDELRSLSTFDAVIATTERDAGIFREHLPNRKITAINNGVDSSFLEPLGEIEDPYSLVFTGKMDFYPNEHGILNFIDTILPLVLSQAPRCKLTVVGAYPTRRLRARESDNVIVTGFVQDVRPFMARAQVYIIPLFIGGGIRGKALEAMAMKKAIVTTSVGCESIHLRSEESALFADTPKDFAHAIVRLFEDSALRERLGNEAQKNVIAGYSWEQKGKDLNRLYHEVLEGRRPDTSTFRRAVA